MTLPSQILKQFPNTDTSAVAMQAIAEIGNHFETEIKFLQAQRPSPVPTPTTPKTPIGKNFQKCLDLADAVHTKYNKSKPEDEAEIKFNPWNEPKFVGYHILKAFVTAYEINLVALITYYNTPTGGTPTGYPTTPITKPIVIPAPVVPPLVSATISAYLLASISAGIPQTDPTVIITPELQKWIQAWSDFLVTDVFI